MDIKQIRNIIKANFRDEITEKLILSVIADDKEAIPTILNILQAERERKEELLLDTNSELSRALIVLKDKNLKYNKKIVVDPKWVVEQIINHYKKWKDYIGCCFRIEELEENGKN